MREDSVYMSAHAETVAEAFSAAIARMLDDSCPGDARRRDGSLFAPIRAEAGDLHALFAGLVESVRGESDNLGMPVAGARIDGVVRSDDGFVAWGVIELDRDARPTGQFPSLTELPLVNQTAAGVTVEAWFRRDP